jgi:hypothetical protein
MGWVVTEVHRLSGNARQDPYFRRVLLWLKGLPKVSRIAQKILAHPEPIILFSGNVSREIAARVSGVSAFKIFVGNPRGRRRLYDVAIASSHGAAQDQVGRPDFYESASLTLWMDGVPSMPAANDANLPITAVFIGGRNKAFAMSLPDLIRQMGWLRSDGQSLHVAFSRRTPPEIESGLRAAFPATDVKYISGDDRAGYLDLLAHARKFAVTPDSITMMCEACATGRDVSLFSLPVLAADTSTYRNASRFLQCGYVVPIGNASSRFTPWPGMQHILPPLRKELAFRGKLR